jgi:hypothetical protein
MYRRFLLIALTALMLCAAVPAEAQQPGKVPHVVHVSTAGASRNPGPQVEVFRQGLRDLGYIEERTASFSSNPSRSTHITSFVASPPA